MKEMLLTLAGMREGRIILALAAAHAALLAGLVVITAAAYIGKAEEDDVI